MSRLTTWWRERQRTRAIRSASAFAEREELTAAAHTLPERPRILLLKLDHIGDLVVAMRGLLSIRQAWPDAHLTLVCGPWNADLAQQLGIFDRIIPYRFFPDAASPLQADARDRHLAFAALDLGEPFDLAIDMRHDEDTRALLDSVSTRFRAGYAARDLKVPLDLELPAIARASPGNRPPSSVHAELRPILLASAVVATFGRQGHPIETMASAPILPDDFPGRRYITVGTGAGKPTCKWPIANFVALCTALAQRRDHDIVLIGAKHDSADGRAIAQALPAGRVRDAIGQPIGKLPPLLANASLYVGNDTGQTHMAAALGVPTLCIFSGVSDHRVWQPRGTNVRTIRTAIGCSPCRLKHEESCPVGVKCLTLLSADDVLSIALAMLDEADSKRSAVVRG